MRLGDRICSLRIKAGITQKELSEMLGVSASSVGMYEQGRRTPKDGSLLKLSEIFGVSINYLLTGDESNTPTLFQSISTIERHLRQKSMNYVRDSNSEGHSLCDEDIEVFITKLRQLCIPDSEQN